MLENIALVLQIHQGLSRAKAHKIVSAVLDLLNLEKISQLRYESCSNKEIFLVQIIRACIQKDAKIIIEQPFILLNEEASLDFIFETLDMLGIAHERVLVIDLQHQENYYKESGWHIIK